MNCQRCTGPVPVLPYLPGQGEYCSQACRQGRPALVDPYERQIAPGDAVTVGTLAAMSGLGGREAAIACLVLLHAGIPVTVDGVVPDEDQGVFAEYQETARDAYQGYSRVPPEKSGRLPVTWPGARRAGAALRSILAGEEPEIDAYSRALDREQENPFIRPEESAA